MTFFRLPVSVLVATAAAAALTACGGGGGSSSTLSPPAAPAVLVSGTGATGAAIAAGNVTLKCVSGTTAVATTGTDGSFTIDIGSVTLPCVGRIDYKDSTGAAQKLHTFINAPGTANITPLTELVVTSLTSGTAVDAFDKFDATRAKAFTAAQVTTAIAAVKAYLVTLGVSVADFPSDPIGAKFIAKNGTTSGDKADAVLDALAANLTASKRKLSDAVDDVAKGSSGGAGGAAVGAGSNTFVVTNATVATRNGTYKVSSALGSLPAGNTDIDYNGNGANGKFEWDVQYTAAGVIKNATVWYYEPVSGGQNIVFFGCGASNPCTGVTYDATGKQVSFVNAVLLYASNTDRATIETKGSSVTVNGAVSVK